MGTVVILIIAVFLIRAGINWYKSEYKSYEDETGKMPRVVYAEEILSDIGSMLANANNRKFIQYFAQIEDIAKRYRENALVAQEMEGNYIALKETVQSISSNEDEIYIIIGKDRYGIDYSNCTCTLVQGSKEMAKNLKAGETVIVIGILARDNLEYLKLRYAQIVYMNGDYVPGAKKDMQRKYGDVELSVY